MKLVSGKIYRVTKETNMGKYPYRSVTLNPGSQLLYIGSDDEGIMESRSSHGFIRFYFFCLGNNDIVFRAHSADFIHQLYLGKEDLFCSLLTEVV